MDVNVKGGRKTPSLNNLAPSIPARSANPSLPEAEIRMGGGRFEEAKAGPHRGWGLVVIGFFVPAKARRPGSGAHQRLAVRGVEKRGSEGRVH